MTDGKTRKYLVHIDLGKAMTPQQLQTAVPQIMEVLTSVSRSQMELAYRSPTGEMFGFFLASAISAKQIMAALESPGKSVPGQRHIKGSEFPDAAMMAVELGEDYLFGRGTTRVGTWFQRH